MKKSIRSLFSLLLVLTLVLSLCGSALAADTAVIYTGKTTNDQGNDVGNFTFDNKYGNAYTATDLFDGFKNVMPGDKLTQKVTFENQDKESGFVKLYMVVVPHDGTDNPLSKEVADHESLTTMTEFLQQLDMKVYKNSESDENLLFSGKADVAGVAGVNQGRIYLGDYRFGEKCTLIVKLDVPLTMGDEYAHRVGEVDWKFTVEAFDESQLVVRKVWKGDSASTRPESITVNLLKDGAFEKSAVLDASNDWQVVFDRLVEGYTWTVEEAEVPSGYTVSYKTEGNETVITNTKKSTPSTPVTPPSKPTPPKDEPKEEPKEEPETSDVYVTKVWEDDSVGRPGSVTLNLLKNGVVYDTVTITEANGWAYAWTELDGDYTWTVEEANVPEGYEVSYVVDGDKVTVTNSKLQSRTVKKVWSGDDEKSRPDAVTVTLYNGENAVETVQLGQWNDWTHTWEGLSASGNWQVTETSIPKGYTPSYSVSGDVVTVTNTATLIQTGQLNWPIPVMAGCGVLLLALAWVLLRKKKNA